MDYIFSESWIKQMKLGQSSFYTLKWCLHMLLNLECSKDDFLLVNSTDVSECNMVVDFMLKGRGSLKVHGISSQCSYTILMIVFK